MDSATSIRTFLDAVRGRLLWRARLRATLYGIAALSVLALAAPLAALAWPGTTTILLSLIGLAAVVAAVAIGGWIQPRRRFSDRREAARHVGARVPPMASDLLSVVELIDQPAATAPCSEELVAALVESTAHRCKNLRLEAMVERRELRRPVWVAIASAATVAVCVGLAPQAFADGWNRLLARGPADPFAGASLVGEPLVGDIELRLHYPMYSGRPDVVLPSSSGDFSAMPGTVVSLETRAIGPAAAARILFSRDRDGGAEDARDTLDLELEGERVTGEFTVEGPIFYRFLLESAAGERRVEALPHRVEVEADRAPTVELHAPADELDVAKLERIEIAYVAEDDYGISRAELVIGDGDQARRIALPVPGKAGGTAPRRAQTKYIWDLADIELEPGKKIAYHVEIFDNDDVTGPNVGSSRTYHLRVFSPRERHEEVMARQRELVLHLLDLLGGRLTTPGEDVAAHRVLHRQTGEIVVEIGTLLAALDTDELTPPPLAAELEAMRGRLEELAVREAKLLGPIEPGATASARLADRIARSDAAHVTELEDDVIRFADWLQRQEVENLLAISDEVDVHRERLGKLLEEYERTGSSEIRAEIERELDNLEQRMAELAQQRSQVPADVLDRFVNAEAIDDEAAIDCFGEVRALLDAGKVKAAQARMKECAATLDEGQEALEDALRDLRGERFTEEEKNYQELMDELADVTGDQKEIANDADAIYERYAEAAAETMKDRKKETQAEVGATLDELRERLGEIPEEGLTPFAKEEREILESRLDDVERRLAKGDVADALAMARQAEASLEIVHAELATALEEGWNQGAEDAERAARAAQPLAQKLVEDLERATPSPEKIMSPEDRQKLDRLRRRQQSVRQKSERLADRARELEGKLPGESGAAMAKGLKDAGGKMGRAESRMRASDPSGARHQAREAAESLSRAQERTRGAARQRQDMGQTGLRDEPVRIPGADEYAAPEKFREELLDAMKETAPSGYGELVERYYQELIK